MYIKTFFLSNNIFEYMYTKTYFSIYMYVYILAQVKCLKLPKSSVRTFHRMPSLILALLLGGILA